MVADSSLLCLNFLDDASASPAEFFRAMQRSDSHNAIERSSPTYSWKNRFIYSFPEREQQVADKETVVNECLDTMTTAQKIGHCFVIGHVGPLVNPGIRRRIREYYPAGVRFGVRLRAKTCLHDPYAYAKEFWDRVMRYPSGDIKDYARGFQPTRCTNEQMCEVFNTLKQDAVDTNGGVPLHFTFDMEGGFSADYCYDGTRFFPQPMGIKASGDKQLAYDVAWAVSRQMHPLGFNWIHSPVLDVNTNPRNPEDGTRSYAETPDEVIEWALEGLKGFQDGKIVTSGKHFPGKGAAKGDSHKECPVIDMPKGEVMEQIRPYKALIDAGMPCIMTAHVAVPALDDSGMPATLSKTILTDMLKGELGFKGVITTDDITMGGIVSMMEVADAVIQSLKAGSDLILLRDDSSLTEEVMAKVRDAAESGELPMERIEDAVRRTLSVKYDYGMFDNLNIRPVEEASAGIRDPKVEEICVRSARLTTMVHRNKNNAVPISRDAKVLLVEQFNPLQEAVNDMYMHPGLLWEKMCEVSDNVGSVEITMDFTDDDKERITRRLDEPEVFVFTNVFWRRAVADSSYNDFIIDVQKKTGKPVIVVTNNHYPYTCRDEFETVVLSYNIGTEGMAETARLLFGEQ